MKIPTVTQCCCGIDLITAGKILGILPIIAATILILMGESIIPRLIVIGLDAVWLYGLFKEKPNFMLPKVIMGAIGIGMMYLFAIYLAIFGHSTEIIKLENDEVVEEKVSPWAMVFILVVSATLASYFWIVIYSVFCHIKYNEKDSIPGENIPPKDEV